MVAQEYIIFLIKVKGIFPVLMLTHLSIKNPNLSAGVYVKTVP